MIEGQWVTIDYSRQEDLAKIVHSEWVTSKTSPLTLDLMQSMAKLENHQSWTIRDMNTGAFVGHFFVKHDKCECRRCKRPTYTLIRLFIDPYYRRRGIALRVLAHMRTMVEATTTQGKQTGFEYFANEYELPSQLLLRKAGWVCVKQIQRKGELLYKFTHTVYGKLQPVVEQQCQGK